MKRNGETLIVGASRRSRDMRPDGVEDTAILFVQVKSVVQELAEKTSGLRAAVGINDLAVNRKVRTVTKGRRRIANRGEPDTCDNRLRCLIGYAVITPWFKPGVQLQLGNAIGPSDESPFLAGNDHSLIPKMVPHGQPVGFIRLVNRRINHGWLSVTSIFDEETFRLTFIKHQLLTHWR